MKTLLLWFVLSAPSSLALAAGLESASFDVENMTCPACAITIEKALERVDGVRGVLVEAEHATVKVEFDPARSTPAAIEAALSGAGFPAQMSRDDG
jgi:copper chaperone CopZ